MSTPDANGVYEAQVEMSTPDGRWIEKKTNGGVNTMFPNAWDAARVKSEIESAWASRQPHPANDNMWVGKSTSGVKIEGIKDPRTTAYPVFGTKK